MALISNQPRFDMGKSRQSPDPSPVQSHLNAANEPLQSEIDNAGLSVGGKTKAVRASDRDWSMGPPESMSARYD